MAEIEKNDGGPAFPSRGGMMFYVPEEARGDVDAAVQALDRKHEGLSLRDYFAAKALQGELASQHPDFGEDNYSDCPSDADGLANWAYLVADSMLRARSK